MIYKLKVEGYKYPLIINTDLIPIMYIRRFIDKNKYELVVNNTPRDIKIVINALENRNFIEFMGGEVEE